MLNLKKNLQLHGSDLMIRYGAPENIIPSLCRHLEWSGYLPVEVYLHKEVNRGFESQGNGIGRV